MQRDIIAPNRPSLRPICWCSGARRLVVMEMNTMLSTPSTTSKNISVSRLIQASGVAKMERSIVIAPLCRFVRSKARRGARRAVYPVSSDEQRNKKDSWRNALENAAP